MRTKLFVLLPLVVTITALSGLIYVAGRQILRQSANDPQIAMSEDLAAQLVKGTTADGIMTSLTVDIAQSLSPYVILYDESGNVVASQATLDGATPSLPKGVLESTKRLTQNRVTWQPKPGVRSAIVVTYYVGPTKTGFILVGRSLREVEKRKDQLLKLVGLSWLLTLGATYVAVLIAPTKKSS